MSFPTAQELSTRSKPPSSSRVDERSAPRRTSEASQELFGVYIHWPYCASKCPYCDFNSYARRTISEEQFLEAALRELQFYAELTPGRAVTSVFFGGGTPSLMAPSTVAALLDRIGALWRLAAPCEITLEANPSSVEAERFAGYRAAGVNRVSLGLQSLSDEQLRFLGRLHSAQEARAALAIACKLFERVSFDLIYARPGQTAGQWRQELSEALPMARGHLSLYQLTIEPETAFFDLERRGKLHVPEAEEAASLYEITQEMCESAGLPAYEISNHAAPGEESLHNLTYWRYGDYVGVGPGAHGRLTLGGRKIATAAIRAPEAWRAGVARTGHGQAERAELTSREEAEEMILMGLRLREGLPPSRLESTGFACLQEGLEAMEAAGLIEPCALDSIRATKRGQLVLNAIVENLTAGLHETAPRP